MSPRYSKKELFALGPQRTFSGPHLDQIGRHSCCIIVAVEEIARLGEKLAKETAQEMIEFRQGVGGIHLDPQPQSFIPLAQRKGEALLHLGFDPVE